jgi:hypothetical protein
MTLWIRTLLLYNKHVHNKWAELVPRHSNTARRQQQNTYFASYAAAHWLEMRVSCIEMKPLLPAETCLLHLRMINCLKITNNYCSNTLALTRQLLKINITFKLVKVIIQLFSVAVRHKYRNNPDLRASLFKVSSFKYEQIAWWRNKLSNELYNLFKSTISLTVGV